MVPLLNASGSNILSHSSFRGFPALFVIRGHRSHVGVPDKDVLVVVGELVKGHQTDLAGIEIGLTEMLKIPLKFF